MVKNFDEIYKEIENEALKSYPRNLLAKFLANNEKMTDNHLVLYGAGGNCEFALFTCALLGITVTCVCDSKATGKYRYREQVYDIISPDNLSENYSDAFVLITPWQYEQEIYDFLCGSGFPEAQIGFLRFPQILAPEIFREKHLEGYRWAYNFFADECSRKKILDRMRLLLCGQPCSPDSLYEDGYFAFPDIVLRDNEVYLDGGAYIGDTAEEFIGIMERDGKEYRHIYSFEPDPKNYRKTVENLSKYSRIDVIPCGLSSKETELRFASTQVADSIGSHIAQDKLEDTIIIPVTSLDLFFADKPQEQWPTIIKMDIEGEEKEALLGAEHIIQTHKPQMIICAYHKPEDIYELPQTILKMRDDYKISFWQIGKSFWDIILYAV
ncbi:MAG: FkbM family methyltransferase [Dorea sp.]|jgi:methyltransferase, FkbM family|nr:FkbM family methyltransferase [Dorea sp.]